MASWSKGRAIAEAFVMAIAVALGVFVVATGEGVLTIVTGLVAAGAGAYWLRFWVRHLFQGGPRPLGIRESARLFRREDRRRLGRAAIGPRLQPGETIEFIDRALIGRWRSVWVALTNGRVLVVPFSQTTLEMDAPMLDFPRNSVRVEPVMKEMSGLTTLGLRGPDDSRVQVNLFRDARDVAEAIRVSLTPS